MEKYIENLDKASAFLNTAEHLLYITYPLVKEKRLLLKVLNETYLSILYTVNAILQYEYVYKRIKLNKDANENFNLFKNQCANRFNITVEQVKGIETIFDLAEKHKTSPFEFVKENKIVIMSSTLKTEILTVEKIKELLFLVKEVLRKSETIIKNKR